MLMHINETLNEFQFDLQFSRRLGAQCRPAPASASFRAKCKSGCAKLASTDGFLTVSLAHTMQIFWLISMFWLCALGGATVGPDDSSGRELMSTFNCLFPAIFFLFFLFVERELCMDNLCKFIRSCLISDRGVLWMPRRCFKCRHWFCIFISSSSIRLQLFESVSGGNFFLHFQTRLNRFEIFGFVEITSDENEHFWVPFRLISVDVQLDEWRMGNFPQCGFQNFAFWDLVQSIGNVSIRKTNSTWKWAFFRPVSTVFHTLSPKMMEKTWKMLQFQP